MALIEAAELAALEEVAELGMETEVSVLRYMRIERQDHDDLEEWVTTVNTTAMIWDDSANPRFGVRGGVSGESESYKALVRREIEVRPGDHLGVDGQIFFVSGVNEFDTYQPARLLALRRFE